MRSDPTPCDHPRGLGPFWRQRRAVKSIAYRYYDLNNPDKKIVYTSTILDMDDKPTFRVTPETPGAEGFTANTSTAAWTMVGDRVSRMRATKTAISGPHFFGLTHPEVVRALERLPCANRCAQYIMKKSLPPKSSEVHKKSRTTATAKMGDKSADDPADASAIESGTAAVWSFGSAEVDDVLDDEEDDDDGPKVNAAAQPPPAQPPPPQSAPQVDARVPPPAVPTPAAAPANVKVPARWPQHEVAPAAVHVAPPSPVAARQQVVVTAIVNGIPEHENFVVSRWPLTIGRKQLPGAGQYLQLSNDKTISREHIRVTVDATGQAESGLTRLYRLRQLSPVARRPCGVLEHRLPVGRAEF
jgi:hypothetical protein